MSSPLALIVTIFTRRLILRGYHFQSVLLLTGIMLLLITHFSGMTSLSGLMRKSTGSGPFDAFELTRDTLSVCLGGLGLQIMLVGGLATYTSTIDVSQVLARMTPRPLQRLNLLYLLLGLALLLDQFLSLFISGAIGLGLLLMATLYSLLTRLGYSRTVVAAVIANTCAVELGSGFGNSVLAAETVGIEVMDRFMQGQLLIVVPVILFVALLHTVTQRSLDRRGGGDSIAQQMQTLVAIDEIDVLIAWLFLSMPPLVLTLVCSDLVLSFLKVTLDIAVLISLAIMLVREYCRHCKARKAMAGAWKVFGSMGSVFAIAVTLVIAGEVFSTGPKAVGAVSVLLSFFGEFGLNAVSIILLMTLITSTTSALTSSGNAAFFSFAPMVLGISLHIGSDIAVVVLPIQILAGIGRALLPIAGVTIAIVGIAGVSPVDIVECIATLVLNDWLLMIMSTFARPGYLLVALPWLATLVLPMVGDHFWQRWRKQPLAV